MVTTAIHWLQKRLMTQLHGYNLPLDKQKYFFLNGKKMSFIAKWEVTAVPPHPSFQPTRIGVQHLNVLLCISFFLEYF